MRAVLKNYKHAVLVFSLGYPTDVCLNKTDLITWYSNEKVALKLGTDLFAQTSLLLWRTFNDIKDIHVCFGKCIE